LPLSKVVNETQITSLGTVAYWIARTTPLSTRMAAPVVAEARGLHRCTIMFATSSVVANLFKRDVGRTVLKNSASKPAESPPALAEEGLLAFDPAARNWREWRRLRCGPARISWCRLGVYANLRNSTATKPLLPTTLEQLLHRRERFPKMRLASRNKPSSEFPRFISGYHFGERQVSQRRDSLERRACY
jgi:hypothetical protein